MILDDAIDLLLRQDFLPLTGAAFTKEGPGWVQTLAEAVPVFLLLVQKEYQSNRAPENVYFRVGLGCMFPENFGGKQGPQNGVVVGSLMGREIGA